MTKWTPGASEGVVVAGGNGKGSQANQLNAPFGIALDNLQICKRFYGNKLISFPSLAIYEYRIFTSNGTRRARDLQEGPG